MWVLTKFGVLGDGGGLVRLFLGDEPIPVPGPGTGYLVKLVLYSGGALFCSPGKLTRGLVD
jgi:hypothetical protein